MESEEKSKPLVSGQLVSQCNKWSRLAPPSCCIRRSLVLLLVASVNLHNKQQQLANAQLPPPPPLATNQNYLNPNAFPLQAVNSRNNFLNYQRHQSMVAAAAVVQQRRQHQQINQRSARYAMPEVQPPGIIIVPGFEPAPPALVLPDEHYFIGNISGQELNAHSYVIDNKRYVESVATRCFSSTILENPSSVEPSFVLIRPNSELRLNGTVPPELIRLAGFEPQKRTTIFIHGFTQSYPSTTWLRRVRALFELNAVVPRQNLIFMDWGVASQGSYGQVAARVSGMASFLANFLTKLIQLGADRMGIHLIGHSLGAHVAGFAGKRIRPRIGRITGLDPAGPCFGKVFSNGPQDRLSADDAFEVDVYHYDDNFLGLPGQHGQFDVYVNGGSSQPGCKDDMNAVFQALITVVFRRNRVLSESHTRSTEVTSQQLSNNGCQQVAYECRDYSAFTQGECGQCDDLNNQCFFMGFDFQYRIGESSLDNAHVPLRTSFPGKRLYITTGPNELYCLHHYQIVVRFEPSNELAQASKRNKWRLQVELLNEQQKRVDLTITNQMAPGVFTYLLLTEMQPVRFKGARLQTIASDGNLIPLEPNPQKKSPFRVLAIEINFMSNVNPNARRSLSSRLCPLVASPSPVLGFAVPSPESMNAIADSGASGDAWNYFEECLVAL